MSRSIDEWIASHDDQAIPARVKVRFHESYIPEPNSGCWLWVGSLMNMGYGTMSIDGKNKLAHRISYQIARGSIPDGAYICHRCDNTFCVNPEHLFAGTQTDNMRDCAKKGRNVTPTHQGEDHSQSKLTNSDVLAIRSDKRRASAIAATFNVSRVNVWLIKTRRAWGHLT